MWIVAGVVVFVIVAFAAGMAIGRKRSAGASKRPAPKPDESLAPVHALDDALRTVESLTDATGSSLLDQVDRDGRSIRDRLASGEAHLDSLRQPDDTGPLLRRVLDEVAGANPAPDLAPPVPPQVPPSVPGA
jgi:hypothetical protein